MKQVISSSIITAIAITTAVAINSAAEAASLNLSGITFTEASSNITLTGGEIPNAKYRYPFILFQDITDNNVSLKIEGVAKNNNYIGGIFHPKPSMILQLVVSNKTNTYWREAKHELLRTTNDYDLKPNDLLFGMPYQNICPIPMIMSMYCSWELGRFFDSDKFTKADDTLNTVIFTNPNNYSIAPGETVTFNYAIADWGEGGFYLKQSYTGYSEQEKSVPETTSVLSLLALGTVGFAYLLKRK